MWSKLLWGGYFLKITKAWIFCRKTQKSRKKHYYRPKKSKRYSIIRRDLRKKLILILSELLKRHTTAYYTSFHGICIYTQKLSPRFIWVSKFHVKLGVVVKNFEITAGRWRFLFSI